MNRRDVTEELSGCLTASRGGSMDLPPFRQAVAMLADSWNSR